MRTFLSACAALALVCLAAGAAASEKPQPLSDEEFAAQTRKFLVAERYDSAAYTKMSNEGWRRGQDAYRRALEAEAQKVMDNQHARRNYLSTASTLGASELYWKTALAEIKGAATSKDVAIVLGDLTSYLDKSPDAHKEQLGVLSALVWPWADKAEGSAYRSILYYLARDEPGKVRPRIEQKLTGELDPFDRRGLIELYAGMKSIPEQDRLALLKKELAATEQPFVASSIQNCLEPFLGEDEAYKLVRPKLQGKRFRGLSQTELRQEKVSFELIDTPLRDGLGFFRDNVGLDLKYDADAQKIVDSPASVVMKTSESPATTALARMLAPFGLMWKMQGSEMLIAKGTMKDTTTAVELAAIGKMMQRKATMEFNGSNVEEALSFLSDMSGLNFWIDEGSRKEMDAVKVAGKFEGKTVGELLGKMLTPHGLKHRILHGGIQIYKDARAK